MKKLLLVLCGVTFLGSAASAAEVRNVITDSVQLTVNGSATSTSRLASEYAVSGSNITATTLGGVSAGTAGTAMTITDGDYEVTTGGQAFTFSESGITGDSLVTTQAVDSTTGNILTHNTYGELVTTTGNILTHNTYGDLTTTTGGTKGTLAGTLSATTIPSVTAGGQGTTAIGQRTVTLSVFE